jgi:hypothetical protein
MLWRVYQNEVEGLAIKYGAREHATEAEMYHGTSGTPPITIYKSEEGFDMRFSNAGMWGFANYFAKAAAYSNNYAYKDTGNGTRQIFCAKVLIGKASVLGPDQNLKRPPLIPGTDTMYDSV